MAINTMKIIMKNGWKPIKNGWKQPASILLACGIQLIKNVLGDICKLVACRACLMVLKIIRNVMRLVKTAKVLSVFYKELIVGKRAMCIKI